MKKCPNCNTQNSDTANFCRRCGLAFPETNKRKSGYSHSAFGKNDFNELQGSLNNSEIEELKVENENLRNKNSLLSKANDSLQQNLSKIQKSLSKTEKENEDLKREYEELQKSRNTIHFIYIFAFIVVLLYLVFSTSGTTSNYDSQLLNAPNQLSSQQKNEAILYEEDEDMSYESQKIFDVVEQQPTFPGGQTSLMSWLSDNIQYPSKAEENGIQGQVEVSIVVEPDGSISNVQIARSVDPALDNEAVRVISNMPKWNPGKQDGQPVRVKYNIPITFKLQ